MADMQSIREMIQLDAFLFGGVPEIENPVYGRDTNASVMLRMTRSCATDACTPELCNEETFLEEIIVDFDSGELKFGEYLPDSVK